jgi:excisionase family DNA binding protein
MSIRDETFGLPPRPTIRQASDATGFSDITIRRRITDGTLKAYRVGPRAIRIDRDSLLAMLRPIGA